jgi:hypothetical protein
MGQAVRRQRLGYGLGIERTAAGERAWLSMLVATMEKISRREVRTVPCDPRLLAMVHLQLRRSMAPRRPINHAAGSNHRIKRVI